MTPTVIIGIIAATATVSTAAYKAYQYCFSEKIDPAIESIKAAMDTLTKANQGLVSKYIEVAINGLNEEQKAVHKLGLMQLLNKKIEALSSASVQTNTPKENVKMERLLKEVLSGIKKEELQTEGVFRMEASQLNKQKARVLYKSSNSKGLVSLLKSLPIVRRCSVIKNLINSFLGGSVDFTIQKSLANFLFKVANNSETNLMTVSNLKIAFPACQTLEFPNNKKED